MSTTALVLSIGFVKDLIPNFKEIDTSYLKFSWLLLSLSLILNLISQVTGRVRWKESVVFMHENGIEKFIEPGCGKVLTVMLRRIVKGLNGISIDTEESLVAFNK